MDNNSLPPVGGGYPVLASAGRVVNPIDPAHVGTLILTLTKDAAAEATGRRVVEVIRNACVDNDLEDVATLHALFGSLVSRVPEFHVLLHELYEIDPTTIPKLLRLPKKGAGRPREDSFFFVSLIDWVMDTQENCESVSEAVDWLMDNRSKLRLPDNYLPVSKTLQNKHAALGDFYRLWSSSMYVPPELLTLLPPLPPGMEYPPAIIEKARYPSADGAPWPSGIVIEIRSQNK